MLERLTADERHALPGLPAAVLTDEDRVANRRWLTRARARCIAVGLYLVLAVSLVVVCATALRNWW